MNLIRWPTVVSECRDLCFVDLRDFGSDGLFSVKDSSGVIYDVLLDACSGPYLVSDEEFLTKYWSVMTHEVGSTFIVDDSDLMSCFPGVMQSERYQHYVVATFDKCLEVLSTREPAIRISGGG